MVGSEMLGEIDLTLYSSTTQFSDRLRLLANNAAPELYINKLDKTCYELNLNTTFAFCCI